MEDEGVVSERHLQLLRSSPMVSNELMNLTLGDDERLTEETVTEILERVTGEIKREEADRADQFERDRSTAQQALEEQTERSTQLERERFATQQALEEQAEMSAQRERERLTTQQALEEQIQQNNRIRSNLYWDCRKRAKNWAVGISLVLSLILIAIIVASQLEPAGLPQWGRWSITSVATVLTVANLYGLTMKGTYPWYRRHSSK